MKKTADTEKKKKGQEQKEKFIFLWKRAEDWQKPSLLHDLHARDEFRIWPSQNKLKFLMSVLQENNPLKSNLVDEKFKIKREIFTKTFTILMSGRYDHLLFENTAKDSTEKKLEKLIALEKILKSFENIQYPYYTSNTLNFVENFFFLNSPPKRSLSAFLQHTIEYCFNEMCSSKDTKKTEQVMKLSIKVATQSFNITLLKKYYRYAYYRQIILHSLKEEYNRCIKVILEKKCYARPRSEEERILKEGEFSEQISFLLNKIDRPALWISFMLKVMALEGEFDEIEI